MTRIFKSKVIQQQLSDDELNALVNDFREYKVSGIVPEHFGRDVPYDHPNTLPTVKKEDVRHIHLGSEDNPLPIKKIQFYRTSDVHLVYCQGSIESNTYLLMAILSPDAHRQALNRDVMFKLGVMAEKFRNNY